jgi:hypothetical protein
MTDIQIVRIIELLESIDKKLTPNNKTAETLPDVVTVQDIKSYLNVGITQAYSIINKPEFTHLSLGQKICIPKDQFLEWTEKERHKKAIGIAR